MRHFVFRLSSLVLFATANAAVADTGDRIRSFLEGLDAVGDATLEVLNATRFFWLAGAG